MPDTDLIETLRDAQRFGFFGAGSVEDAAEHARQFVVAIEAGGIEAGPVRRVCDLGSGGGLPGLVVAEAQPAAEVLLLDRRQKRTDFLLRAVSRLGWEHVVVRCADVAELIDEVVRGEIAPFDVVTARGFGPPEFTLRSAAAITHPAGRIVISEPPVGDRWAPSLLAELGLVSRAHGGVRVFEWG